MDRLNSTNFILVVFLLSVFSTDAGAQINDSEDLLEAIDEIDAKFENHNRYAANRSLILEEKITTINTNLNAVDTFMDGFEKKYEEITDINKRFIFFTNKVDELAKIQAVDQEKYQSLLDKIDTMESGISNSKEIVTWVTLIVTVAAVLGGIFFSKVFLDLYANYAVLADRQKREMRLNEEPNATETGSPIKPGVKT